MIELIKWKVLLTNSNLLFTQISHCYLNDLKTSLIINIIIRNGSVRWLCLGGEGVFRL